MQETTTQMQEPTPSGPRRRTVGLAALAGAIGVGAIVLGLVVTAGSPSGTPAAATGATVPSVANEATWTSPDGRATTQLRGFDGPGRGGRDGVGGSAITITAISGTKLSLETDNGWTRTIDASGATVTKDGATAKVSDLEVGDRIWFRETHNDDGTYTITAIQVVQPSVSGTVASVSGSTVTVTQRDGSTAKVSLTSSTTFTIDDQAATKDAVVTGARIVARGTLGSDGTLTATSVDVRPAMSAGTVKEKSATSITLTTRDGSTVVVKVTSSTTYQVAGIERPTLANIAVGDAVVASGTRNADGSLTATAVRARAAGQDGGPWGGGRMGDGMGPGMGPGMGGHGRGGGWDDDAPGASPAPSTAPSGTGTNG